VIEEAKARTDHMVRWMQLPHLNSVHLV